MTATATYVEPSDLDPINESIATLTTAAQNGKQALQLVDQRFTENEQALGELDERVTKLEESGGGGGTGSGYTGMPNVVIDHPDDASVKAGIKEWLDSRNGGAFPTKRLLFAFIGTANLTTPLLPANTGQIQGAYWEGLSRGGTVLSWGSSSTPMLTAKGQLRKWVFQNITFNSRVSEGKGMYLWSSQNSPGNNQEGEWDKCEFTGAWTYCVGLDGDAKSNLNSELTFRQLGTSNSSSFSKAMIWSGMSPEFDQQDQFLNFHFEDPTFEANHGTYVRLDKGGNVTFDGFGSWMHIGNNIDADSDPSPMIYIPEGSHFDSTMFLSAIRQRIELRHPWSKFIDSGWTGRGRIVLDSVDTTSKAYLAKTPEQVREIMTFRNGHTVTMRSTGLGGFVGLRGSKGANIVMEECYSALPDGAGVTFNMTDGANSSGIVRRIDGAGSLKFR